MMAVITNLSVKGMRGNCSKGDFSLRGFLLEKYQKRNTNEIDGRLL